MTHLITIINEIWLIALPLTATISTILFWIDTDHLPNKK